MSQEGQLLSSPSDQTKEGPRKASDSSTCESLRTAASASSAMMISPKVGAEQACRTPTRERRDEEEKVCKNPKTPLKAVGLSASSPLPDEKAGLCSPGLYLSPQTTNAKTRRTCPEDFTLLQLLGVGAYSRVALVEHIATKKKYAMKVMEKKFIMKVRRRYDP